MNETFVPNFDYKKRKWYVIDCKGQQLGRLSSTIITLLYGKLKSYYYPSFDIGDYVILINVEDLTLDKKTERVHVFQPGRPGKSLKRLINVVPKQIVEKCIFGMMPKGIPKRSLAKRLKIYNGPNHPHQAQNPIQVNDINNLNINL
jgi:large subunit ribosomal protein L13